MFICNSIQELYRVSELSYPKGDVIVISIYKIIFPNEKVIKTTERNITLGFIKEYMYDNPVNLLL